MAEAALRVGADNGDASKRPIYGALAAAARNQDPTPFIAQLEEGQGFVLFGAVSAWTTLAGERIARLTASAETSEPLRVGYVPLATSAYDEDAAQELAFSCLGALINGDQSVLAALWETFDAGQRRHAAYGILAILPCVLDEGEDGRLR